MITQLKRPSLMKRIQEIEKALQASYGCVAFMSSLDGKDFYTLMDWRKQKVFPRRCDRAMKEILCHRKGTILMIITPMLIRACRGIGGSMDTL